MPEGSESKAPEAPKGVVDFSKTQPDVIKPSDRPKVATEAAKTMERAAYKASFEKMKAVADEFTAALEKGGVQNMEKTIAARNLADGIGNTIQFTLGSNDSFSAEVGGKRLADAKLAATYNDLQAQIMDSPLTSKDTMIAKLDHVKIPTTGTAGREVIAMRAARTRASALAEAAGSGKHAGEMIQAKPPEGKKS